VPSVLEPLRHRDFRLLWIGQTISVLGNFIYSVALPFQILALGGGALQLGIGASIATGTMVLVLLISGALVDRVPRRRIILVSDFASGCAMTIVALLGLTGQLRIEHLYAAAVVFGAGFAFLGPAITAIIPELVPADVLQSGNAVRGLSRQLAQAGGPIVGGAIVALAGAPAAFAVNAVSFFVSFGALFLARPPRREPPPPAPFFRQIRDGLSFTFSVPWLWITIFLWSFVNFAESGPFIVALPLLVRDVLAGDARMYGAIVAALGAGEILGTFVVAQLRVRRVGLVIYAWALLSAVVSITWGLVPLLPVILVCAAIRGVSIVGFSVLWETSLQRHVPRELLGRVSSIDWFGGVLLVPVAPVVFAVIVEQTGPAASFVIGGSAAFLFILSGLAVRRIRELE
jgi:MFS family permease